MYSALPWLKGDASSACSCHQNDQTDHEDEKEHPAAHGKAGGAENQERHHEKAVP
jgi:hypothetical protein